MPAGDLVREFKVLRKEHLEHTKTKAAEWLQATQAACAAWAGHVLGAPGPAPSPPVPVLGAPNEGEAQGVEPSGPQPTLLLSHRVGTIGCKGEAGGRGAVVKLHAAALPYVEPPPPFDMWTLLKQNEMAQDHGRRMFLVDELGETVPADDGTFGSTFPWEEADGRSVDAALVALARRHGWGSEEVAEAAIAALHMGQQPEAVARRLAHLRQLVEGPATRDGCEVDDVIGAFVGSFCRRCRKYGCRTHGGGHQAPHQRPSPPPPGSCSGPCGPDCWQLAASDPSATQPNKAASALGEAGAPPWSRLELGLIRKGIEVFGAGNPCMVATLVGPHRACAHVKGALDSLLSCQNAQRPRGPSAMPEVERGEEGAAPATSSMEDGEGLEGRQEDDGFDSLARVPARRKGNRAKKTVLSNRPERSRVVASRKEHDPEEPWQEYAPCSCVGRCGPDCPCVLSSNFCEKFCACSQDCRERFQGCNCRSGCKKNTCPCAAAGRECDPDLCGGCAPTIEGLAEQGRECCNMQLRLKQHVRVVLGTSDIPNGGWGTFAAQHVAKGGFIGEYSGDLITQDEANRRGLIYDRQNSSYLFNLNKEWVLDAKSRGNKLRCANHSADPVARAKVLMVDGESRIAIVAEKTLAPGTELTFDYRYSEDTAPQWTRPASRRKGKSKKP